MRTPSPRITLPNGQLWDIMGFHGCQRSEVGFCGDQREIAGNAAASWAPPPARVSALKGRPAAALSAEPGDGCRPKSKESRALSARNVAGRYGMSWDGKAQPVDTKQQAVSISAALY